MPLLYIEFSDSKCSLWENSSGISSSESVRREYWDWEQYYTTSTLFISAVLHHFNTADPVAETKIILRYLFDFM